MSRHSVPPRAILSRLQSHLNQAKRSRRLEALVPLAVDSWPDFLPRPPVHTWADSSIDRYKFGREFFLSLESQPSLTDPLQFSSHPLTLPTPKNQTSYFWGRSRKEKKDTGLCVSWSPSVWNFNPNLFPTEPFFLFSSFDDPSPHRARASLVGNISFPPCLRIFIRPICSASSSFTHRFWFWLLVSSYLLSCSIYHIACESIRA